MTTERIGPPIIPTAQPRKTEENDTRQDILRHDPDYLKKKREKKEGEGFRDPYEDLTNVSVTALKAFLADLLVRAGGNLPHETPLAEDTPGGIMVQPPASPQQAAANAYKTGARMGGYTPPPAATPGPPVPPPPEEKPQSALDQAAGQLDAAELLGLIRALDRLYAQGVTHIGLEKSGEGFLASIRAAIEQAS